MAAVETRRGIFATMIKNQIANALIDFFIILVAFKWMYNSDWGVYLLFGVTAFIYMTGIYSYSYSQTKIDLRSKKSYDWIMPLKIGGASSLLILLPALLHQLLLIFARAAGEYFGIAARLWNYPFFFYIYGRDGGYFNITALIIIAILPVITAYFSYYCGVKKFMFSEKIYKIMYKTEE